MEKEYLFYLGWTEKSRNMLRFFEKNSVPHTIIHQEIGEQGMVFSPNYETFYHEKDFGELREKVLGELN